MDVNCTVKFKGIFGITILNCSGDKPCHKYANMKNSKEM